MYTLKTPETGPKFEPRDKGKPIDTWKTTD